MSIKALYPSTFPITQVDFSNKSFLPPEVEFSRGSSATYIGNDGLIKTALPGEPRFTHDPVTDESLGLLLEDSRTNYLYAYASPSYNVSAAAVYSTYSDSRFGAAQNAHSWTYASAQTSTELGWLNPGSISTTGDSVQYTLSFWGKANQSYVLQGNISDERRQSSNFSFSLTTEWQYFTVSTPPNILDDGTGTVYFRWIRGNVPVPAGLQLDFAAVNLERGGFPTSYIPTSGSTVTRAADTFSIPVQNLKSSRIVFAPSSSTHSLTSPTLTFSDSSSPTPPYSLELSAPSLIPTLVTKYNFIPQSYLSIPSYPPTTPPPSLYSVAFNYDPTTGEMALATSAGEDSDAAVVSLPSRYNIPAPVGYSLDLATITGLGILKEFYTWEETLSSDQLASIGKEYRAVGKNTYESSGLQPDLYELGGARPTLDLNFAKNKNLKNSVNDLSLVSFSRSSGGTYIDELGGVQKANPDEPRFDHDPTTGESLGLLVEEARTNNFQYSQDFAQSYWSKSSITPNSTVAPDGSITGATLTAVASDTNQMLHIFLNPGSSQHTCSIFAKAGTSNWLAISNANDYQFYNLATGELGSTSNNFGSPVGIEDCGNGWYWCYIAPTTTASNFAWRFRVVSADNTLGGTTRDSIYVWGAQLEAGSFPTSYIPTPATFVSRASTATYYDATGTIQTAGVDVARSDAYFPDENGIMRPAGLLLEGESTNLALYSEQLKTNWAEARLTILSSGDVGYVSTTAPDGSNPTYWVPTTVANTHQNVFTTNAPETSDYTASFYVKADPSGYYRFGLRLGGTDSIFNASTGLVESGQFNVQPLTNGWYRISRTISFAIGTGIQVVAYILANDGTQYVPGDGTKGMWVWGAQLEASSYPTSYIPTTTSTVTRAADVSSSSAATRSADVAQIAGGNFSSWYNQSEGTWFADVPNPGKVSSTRIINTGVNLWSGPTNAGYVRTGSSSVLLTTSYPAKVSAKYNDSSLTGAVNGILLTEAGGTNVTATYVDIGSANTAASGVGFINNPISRLTYWPNRLPDAALQAITDPAIETWDIVFDSSLSANGTCAIITNSTCQYNVDWGDGTPTQTISASGTFTATHRYVVPKKYSVKIDVVSGAFMPYYNNSVYADQLVEIGPSPDGWSNASTSGFGTNLSNAWYGANNLKTINKDLNTLGVINFSYTWKDCSGLTSFPLINTSNVTNFSVAWDACSGLTFFPLIDTSKATIFDYAWRSCSGLTSFPLINTSNAASMSHSWSGCANLTRFPLTNTSNVLNFGAAWQSCSGLSSFPALNMSKGTTFARTWNGCSSLTTFPANMFNTTGTLASTAFNTAFTGCALSAQSIENILTSLDTNGQSGITLSINSGTNASNYDWTAGTWSSFNNLISKSWTISYNDNLFSSSSLDLQFATTKTLDSRVTFSRASIGTYVDSNGVIQTAAADTPRFDHDPVTGESLGLLVEEQRTNLMTYSEEFNNTGWLKNTGQITFSANVDVAPDGTSTADQVNNVPDLYSWCRPAVSISSSITYTFSLYVKPLTTNKTLVFEHTGSGNQTSFNLDTLTTSGAGTHQIISISNGWYRIVWTFTGISGLGGFPQFPTLFIGGYPRTSDSASFLFWGAQVEEGSFPTSYIPTAGGQGTRNADEASIVGTDFSSWYNQSEGTWYGEVKKPYPTTQRLFEVGDSTTNQYSVSVRPSSTSTFFARQASGSPTVNHSYPAKFAIADSVTDIQGCVNGTLATLISTGTSVTDNKLSIGGAMSGTSSDNAIARLTYWPKRLPDGALQFITS